MENYQDLRKAVENHGGMVKIGMTVLKHIDGAGRLGPGVLATMSTSLATHGVGHLPPELPNSQDEQVRLYLIDSPLGDVVTAVLNPNDQRDATLRSIGATGIGVHALEQIRQIRQILATHPTTDTQPALPTSGATPHLENEPAPRTPFGRLVASLPSDTFAARSCRTDADYLAVFGALIEELAAADTDLQLAGSLGYRQTDLGQLYTQIAPGKPTTLKLRDLAEAFCRRNTDWVLGRHHRSAPDIRLFYRTLPNKFDPLL